MANKMNLNTMPTVNITEEQAIDKLHETGWLPKHDKEMTERSQGEWMNIDDVCVQCPFCNKVEYVISNYCRQCGARLHKWEEVLKGGKEE